MQDDPLLVACLCAEWCGTCRDYRALFSRAAAGFPGRTQFAWVDIEDHADVVGALDVETFPTLLIARGDAVLFCGPLTPQTSVLARTVEKALAAELTPQVDAHLAGLPARIRGLITAGPGIGLTPAPDCVP
jgi:thioredoxin-like negative regulator of GroEL